MVDLQRFRLSRKSRNSFGPLRSLRLRRCRSSSGANGSIKRSISWAAISDAFVEFLVRKPGWRTPGACSVAIIDLHSPQTMSAASCSFLSFAFITSKIMGCVLLQVGHQTRGKSSFRSRATVALSGIWKVPLAGERPRPISLKETPPEGMAGGVCLGRAFEGSWGHCGLPSSRLFNSLLRYLVPPGAQQKGSVPTVTSLHATATRA